MTDCSSFLFCTLVCNRLSMYCTVEKMPEQLYYSILGLGEACRRVGAIAAVLKSQMLQALEGMA